MSGIHKIAGACDPNNPRGWYAPQILPSDVNIGTDSVGSGLVVYNISCWIFLVFYTKYWMVILLHFVCKLCNVCRVSGCLLRDLAPFQCKDRLSRYGTHIWIVRQSYLCTGNCCASKNGIFLLETDPWCYPLVSSVWMSNFVYTF